MVLLETCGQYFGKGSAAKRLNRFLAYLQRYLLAKPPAPLDVSLDLQVSFASSFPCQVPEPPIVREAHAPAATM